MRMTGQVDRAESLMSERESDTSSDYCRARVRGLATNP
jgi:hypothetical protein